MTREEWYETYRDVRTAVDSVNLFVRSERAGIALEIARNEAKEDRKRKRVAKIAG